MKRTLPENCHAILIHYVPHFCRRPVYKPDYNHEGNSPPKRPEDPGRLLRHIVIVLTIHNLDNRGRKDLETDLKSLI